MVTAKSAHLKGYGILSLLFLALFIFSCKDLEEPKTVPSVVTGEITNGTATSVTVSGQIVTDGNSLVSERGVVIGKNADPTVNDTKVVSGNGIGTFTVDLTGLTAATTYHVRAFGTNAVGTSYGLDKTFTSSATIPTLTTTVISEISYTSSKGGGNLTNNGGSAITARGVCWSLNQNPTVSNSKTTDGDGNGVFVSTLTQLEPNKKYYVRAYATNSVGTAYGEEVNFTTLTQTIPTVITAAISEITVGSSKSGGNVISDGGSTVTSRGVCWSLSPNPTIADSKTADGTGNGDFISSISKLTYNKKFYVRSYATNSIGTAYGAELNFSTPTSPIPTNGLVGWWPFNENAKDESGKGNDGVPFGATLTFDRFGNNNCAFLFDSAPPFEVDYISGPAKDLPSLQSPRTISIWVYSDQILSTSQEVLGTQLFGYGGGNCGTSFIGYFTNTNKFEVQGHCAVSYFSSAVPDQINNKWLNIILVFDGVSIKSYFNSKFYQSNEINFNTSISGNSKYYFGIEVFPNGFDPYTRDISIWKSFKGILDDIAIYNRALSADEIQKIYNGTGF